MLSKCEQTLETPALSAMLTLSRLKFDDKHVNVMHYLEDGCTGTHIGSPPRSMLLAFFGLFRDRLNEILDMEKAQGSGGYACRVNKEDNIDQLFDGDPELLQDVKDAISDLGSIRIVMVQATRCRE